MKPSVIKALDTMLSLSDEFACLARSLQPLTSTSKSPVSNLDRTIEELKAKVDALTAEILTLRMSELPDTQHPSDQDILIFKQSFEERLNKAEDLKSTLQRYDRVFFLPLSPIARTVVANTLVNYCTKNGLVSSDLWRDIVASMGHI